MKSLALFILMITFASCEKEEQLTIINTEESMEHKIKGTYVFENVYEEGQYKATNRITYAFDPTDKATLTIEWLTEDRGLMAVNYDYTNESAITWSRETGVFIQDGVSHDFSIDAESITIDGMRYINTLHDGVIE